MQSNSFIKIKWWAYLATLILVLTAVVSGIRELREPDLWWQLRTGEWILSHLKVMHTDVFSFTFDGVPWINVKWGYEVIIALISKIAGPELIPLFQSVINVLLLFVLYKIYKKFKIHFFNTTQIFPDIAFLGTAWLLLFGLEYRMNARPEIQSQLMCLVFLYFLMSYRFKEGKFIFWLVPLQILWTNIHEAYGIGIVMITAFTFATWIEYIYWQKFGFTQKPTTPKFLSITAILCVFAPAMHPSGIQMIWHFFDIFGQVGENKFTTELLDFKNAAYWQKEAYLSIVFLLLGLVAFFLKYPAKQITHKFVKLYNLPVLNFGLGYILLFIMFFYLSLTAYRNIVFFLILASPAVGMCLHYAIRKVLKEREVSSKAIIFYIVLLLFGVGAYYSIVSNYFYNKIDNGRDRYGLKINALMNPMGAADFIVKNNLKNHSFNDFLVSNYLLWKLQPDFKTFIDLRDLDIFPSDFFNNFGYLSYRPEAINVLDSQFHFNYAVLYRANFISLHKYLANNEHWTPVYADAVAAVYVKNNDSNANIISKYGLKENRDIFKTVANANTPALANFVSKLFNPAWQVSNVQTDPLQQQLLGADYYNSIDRADLALKKVQQVINENQKMSTAYLQLGKVLLIQATYDTIPKSKDSLVNAAFNAYNQAIYLNKKEAQAYFGLGQIALLQGDYGTSEAFLLKSVRYDPKFQNAWIMLAQVQNMLISKNPESTNKLMLKRIDYLEHALALEPSNLMLRFYLGITYGQVGDCKNAVDALNKAPNFPGAPKQDVELAKNILKQCSGW